MYRVVCDGKEIVRQGIDRISAIKGDLSQQLNAADQFNFTLPSAHPYISHAQPRSSLIELWRDTQCLFIGDVVQVSSDIYNDAAFECQGVLAWLNDCVIPHPSFSGQASEYFERLITQYNNVAEVPRKIIFGQSDMTAAVVIDYPDDMKSVFELIGEMISAVGGYLFLRYDDGIYIDYLTAKGRTSGQKIRFGDNMTGLENLFDASELITRVYPTGKDGLDIRAVNSGKWFVSNAALEATHGVISEAIAFSEIDDANTLKSLATAYLNSKAAISQTITLTAIDLSAANARVDRIDIGDNVVVQSAVHGLNTAMVCCEKTTNIVTGANDKITLGTVKKQISAMVGGTK